MNAQAVGRPGGARPAPIALGVIIFIASETMFFGALLGAYYTLRSLTTVWPPADVRLNDPEMAAATAILLASSVPAHFAVHALRQGKPGLAVRRLLLTAAMGMVFLVLKVHDWLTAGFTISSHAYGTIFFTLTGFHALHMAVGIILLAGLAAKIAGGAYTSGSRPAAPRPPEMRGVRREDRLAAQPESGGPDAVVYYWHFVDAVWIAVFSSIWLIR
jgi:heme/copper-type cytochrome/quinol oxidase subunit 3